MNWAATQAFGATLTGEVLFAGPELLRELLKEAEQEGFLPVSIGQIGPAQRGRLGLVIEETIEAALVRRGACAPGIRACADLDASLSDQLYRARLAEHRGIALAVPPLEGIANLERSLDAEDSAVLRWWVGATADRPVRLYLHAVDRGIGVYGPPVALHEWLTCGTGLVPAGDRVSNAAPAVAPEVHESLHAMELSELGTSPDPSSAPEQLDVTPGSPKVALGGAAPLRSVQPEDPPLLAPQPCEPVYPNAEESWNAWMRDLEAARGPKPLGAIERMFVTSYMPLRDARSRGIAGAEADRTLLGWSRSFDQSYREAFDALRVRGKRPIMVLDVPEVAQRIGRLHGARSAQLLVVDGMRFDLGLRVEQRMKKMLGQNAALTERLLLWSALPTRTAVQLELLGRGPDGLKDFSGQGESEITVARGRSAFTVRRVKAGCRELFKLDVVEWRLSVPGGSESARLDALADETARVLCQHFERLAPRTLAMVFGDHGFLLDPLEEGTTAARYGGASPEEVLVPAMAWLVGSVH